MKTIFVVDIDGTICDSKHRVAKALAKHGDTNNWNAEAICEFLDGAANDKRVPGSENLIGLANMCDAEIVLLTGRNEEARQLTREWLCKHFGFDDSTPLFMRPVERLFSSTPECKERMFVECVLEGNHGARFVFFEDDLDTCAQYAKHGCVMQSPMCWDIVGKIVEAK